MVAKKKKVTKSSTSNAQMKKLMASHLKLEHKMADVLGSVKELNGNVSDLIKIFKKAGEHIRTGKYEDPMMNKINDLLEQNKNLQHAVMLLEKFVHEKGDRSPLQQPPMY